MYAFSYGAKISVDDLTTATWEWEFGLCAKRLKEWTSQGT